MAPLVSNGGVTIGGDAAKDGSYGRMKYLAATFAGKHHFIRLHRRVRNAPRQFNHLEASPTGAIRASEFSQLCTTPGRRRAGASLRSITTMVERGNRAHSVALATLWGLVQPSLSPDDVGSRAQSGLDAMRDDSRRSETTGRGASERTPSLGRNGGTRTEFRNGARGERRYVSLGTVQPGVGFSSTG
jgi:hypothetical protein